MAFEQEKTSSGMKVASGELRSPRMMKGAAGESGIETSNGDSIIIWSREISGKGEGACNGYCTRNDYEKTYPRPRSAAHGK